MPELSWEEEFNTLVAEFVESAETRLAAFRVALDRLSEAPESTPALQELKRHFHRLAGTGLTFGFAELSALASQGEELVDERLRAGQTTSPEDLVRYRTLIDALDNGFAGAKTGLQRWRTSGAAPGEGLRDPIDVLIVDDDEGTQKRLVRVLAQEGMAGRRVSTVATARQAIDQQIPSGLIVEITLPDGEGYSVVEYLRSKTGGEQAAVVMLSRLNAFLDQTEAIHAGADACFEKPLDWDALVAKLHQLLDRDPDEDPRILVVEDDESQGAFVRSTLEQAGYQVKLTVSPRHFNEEFATYRPDLLILDIMLPEVNGHDLARFVRQDDQHATLPIIFLTGERDQQARIATVEAGGDDHLVKPVHPSLLVASVAARLERARFLRMLLNRDGLTRLLTHSSFMEQARALVERRRHEAVNGTRHAPATMVILDIDHFKTINDSYGHQAGDRVLKSLSALLRRHVRRSDLIGRYGGEEFAILLDNVHENDSVRLMMRLLREFGQLEHQAPNGSVFRVTFSVGVARLNAPEMDLYGWFNAADGALYAAKKAGRNRVVKAAV
jgi:diguanylate cyclase (GGDEF)-like protein